MKIKSVKPFLTALVAFALCAAASLSSASVKDSPVPPPHVIAKDSPVPPPHDSPVPPPHVA